MVSIDTVYQRVLAISNKEQRGYVTPQEFNLLANQSQMAIFNQYIHDIRLAHASQGNDTEYSNEIDLLNEKIAPFESTVDAISVTDGLVVLPIHDYLGSIQYATLTKTSEIQEVRKNEVVYINSSPIAAPNSTRPIYTRVNATQVQLYPINLTTTVSEIRCNIMMAPVRSNGTDARWGYAVVGERALHNVDETTDFLLHSSEETHLVIKILELAGIVMNKPALAQLAGSEEAQIITQQKQ
tara:strand:+ start:917 stop:1636 length:720 start_codon:yes stop_codon:yes gene_type:complete